MESLQLVTLKIDFHGVLQELYSAEQVLQTQSATHCFVVFLLFLYLLPVDCFAEPQNSSSAAPQVLFEAVVLAILVSEDLGSKGIDEE